MRFRGGRAQVFLGCHHWYSRSFGGGRHAGVSTLRRIWRLLWRGSHAGSGGDTRRPGASPNNQACENPPGGVDPPKTMPGPSRHRRREDGGPAPHAPPMRGAAVRTTRHRAEHPPSVRRSKGAMVSSGCGPTTHSRRLGSLPCCRVTTSRRAAVSSTGEIRPSAIGIATVISSVRIGPRAERPRGGRSVSPVDAGVVPPGIAAGSRPQWPQFLRFQRTDPAGVAWHPGAKWNAAGQQGVQNAPVKSRAGTEVVPGLFLTGKIPQRTDRGEGRGAARPACA